MSISNGTYFVFLIAAFFAFWSVAGRARWGLYLLASASCLFYALTGGRGLLLLLAITIVDFSTTTYMTRAEKRQRRLLLFVSLSIDIGALCAFKYANFFIESTSGLLSLAGVT